MEGDRCLSLIDISKEAGIDNILILERKEELGGILQQCIHNGFGLQTFHEELSGPMYAPVSYTHLEHNGIIDWKAIKRAGVEFAIIRSSYGHFVEDQQFRRNVKECERYKIPYGLYHYSYVANHAQMKEEAEGFLRQCRSCKPAYPCFIDMEDADGWKARHGVSDAMNIETVYYTCAIL